MRLEELKKSFWGYQKDALLERTDQQARARIQDLEQENRALKEELKRFRERHDQISQAILDARASAEAMKAESRAQEESAREAVRQALEQDMAELAGYRERVEELRRAIQETMAGLEQQAEEMEQQVEELYEAVPAGNLTLFQ